MPREPFANAAMTPALDASGWASWAPEIVDAPDLHEPEEAAVPWLGGAISLLMWGCASVMAVWYL